MVSEIFTIHYCPDSVPWRNAVEVCLTLLVVVVQRPSGNLRHIAQACPLSISGCKSS